jgi:hypothetical protein
MKHAWLAPPLTVLSLLGCRDVTRFSTAKGEAYCGQIVKGSFVRTGFAPSAQIRMTFDADHLTDGPGQLSTDDHMLDGAQLRPIPQLANDPLWTLNFGEGREKNLIYAVDPNDPVNGPSITAFLSFLHDGDAEVRLVRGAPSVDGGELPAIDGKVLFGVFAPLHREHNQCGF